MTRAEALRAVARLKQLKREMNKPAKGVPEGWTQPELFDD